MALPNPPSLSSLPPKLRLAAEWAKAAGSQVDTGVATSPDGATQPFVRLMHGPNPVLVRLNGDALVVWAMTQIPEQTRMALAALSANDRSRVDVYLREQLLHDPLVGYAMLPPSMTSIDQIQGVTVERVVFIDPDDPGTRNTFHSAIQEVVSAMHRFILGLRILGQGGTLSSGTSTVRPGGESQLPYIR